MFYEKFHKNLLKALTEAGFEEPKELQQNSIAKINGGFDVIGIGPEDCGRSSLISMMAVQKLQRAFEDPPRAMVLVADKEKAIAMKEQFDLFAKYTDLRSVCVHEDGKIDEQSGEIYYGCDIVIGTAKRLLEIYFQRNLNLNKIKFFAIDDAELMIKKSWQGQVDRLALSLPKCQHLVFTDNLDEKVEKLISKFIVAPIVYEVEH